MTCARSPWPFVLHVLYVFYFFFNDTATTEIYTLSLHDALPICMAARPPATSAAPEIATSARGAGRYRGTIRSYVRGTRKWLRSEEHTSELQSRQYLVCRLLLEKKKKTSHLFLHLSHYINIILYC